jgi:uncharacterized protein YjhX (UPF0386 family)
VGGGCFQPSARARAFLCQFKTSSGIPVNVSRNGQRVLHVLAQGGLIRHLKDENGRIVGIECLTREGWLLSLCTLDLFQSLRRRGFVASAQGGPYRITRLGLQAVRSRPDNR